MTIIGIDPGAAGGVATLNSDGMTVVPMPWLADVGVNAEVMRALLLGADHVVIEDIGVRPGQAVNGVRTSCVNWGRVVGMVEGLGRPLTIVRPQVWMRAMGIPNKLDLKERKARSVAIAQRLFPEATFILDGCRKSHDGMAEAALIAEYGRRTLHTTN